MTKANLKDVSPIFFHFYKNGSGKGYASLTKDEEMSTSSQFFRGDILDSTSEYLLWRDDDWYQIVNLTTGEIQGIDTLEEDEEVINKIWKKIKESK